MKRIVTVVLLAVVLFACIPVPRASAQEGDKGVDGAIASVLNAQLPQEERDALVKIDPSLSDKVLLRVIKSVIPPMYAHMSPEKMIEVAMKREQAPVYERSYDRFYYWVLSDEPYFITLDREKNTITAEHSENEAMPQYIKDILNLSGKVEVNGKQATVTGIYCFVYSMHYTSVENLVCIQTEKKAVFRYYEPGEAVRVLSQREFKKYGTAYYAYLTAENKSGNYVAPFNGSGRSFGYLVEHYNEFMLQYVAVSCIQTMHCYGSFVLGVILLGAEGCIAYFLYTKRKKVTADGEIVPQ